MKIYNANTRQANNRNTKNEIERGSSLHKYLIFSRKKMFHLKKATQFDNSNFSKAIPTDVEVQEASNGYNKV